MSGRELSQVIDQMLAHIPATETALLTGLASIKGSVVFAPPEGMRVHWERCMELLVDSIGDPIPDDKPWGAKVEAIFSGKEAT